MTRRKRYKMPPLTRMLVKRLIAAGKTERARELLTEQLAFERSMENTARIFRALWPKEAA